jgi:HAD superfamily hydrolase (TIGR01509 family)
VIRGLLFDFDGLLVDTESAAFHVWSEIYREHQQELSLDVWIQCVGTRGGFDPLANLERLVIAAGRTFDRAAMATHSRRRELARADVQDFRPGVTAYLSAARERGFLTAVVSSASEPWIARHLARLDRTSHFDAIVAAGADVHRAKPRPTLYLEALDELGLEANEAIAFEDSVHGLRAAKAAGLFCVAVPNSVTAASDFTGADLIVPSLEHLPLDDLLHRAGNG